MLIRAVDRWSEPEHVDSGLMLAVAVVGAVANTIGLLILRGGKDESLNLRGAYLEVLGDLMGSVAVVVAALVIMLTGWTRADSIASLAIVVLILPRAWSLLRDVVDVLLEATPKGVDLATVREHIREVPGVVDVHDLHAWTITSGVPVLSAHVVVDEACITEGRSGRGAGSAGGVPGRPLRRRALHVPARAGRSRRARGRPARVSALARPCGHRPAAAAVLGQMRHAILHLAFEPRGAREASSDALADNTGSDRVSEALGYQPNGVERATREGRPGLLQRWRLTRSDWLSPLRVAGQAGGVVERAARLTDLVQGQLDPVRSRR